MRRTCLFAFWLIFLVPGVSRAEVQLPHLFSDHAVLQRDMPIHLWGQADPGAAVNVQFHDQRITVTADSEGLWEGWLAPERAGGPFSLTVGQAGDSTPIERTDILVGDVWVASGQSNMEFPLKGFAGAPLRDGDKEIAGATQPRLRLLLVHRKTSPVTLYDTEDSWKACTPETAQNFSAIAYMFGREISGRENVPVGLIDTTWGGTPAHAWISFDGIASSGLSSVVAEAGRLARDQGRADQLRAQFAARDAALRAAGKEVSKHERIPEDHGGSWLPATLYNAMISPFTRYTIKGVIWYQGETDATAERAPNYERVFSALIGDWRRQWAQGSFPFLFVQISSFSSHDADWGMLRDAQRRVADEVEGTGMAVSLDRGLTDNVHPPDKQTIAARLALAARRTAYGEQVESRGPEFERATIEGGSMRAWFSHADGLNTPGGAAVEDLEVAGDDRRYQPATGRIEGSTIIVGSPSVPNPKYVRYGWKGTVTSWFYNSSGLPAGTFTSEH